MAYARIAWPRQIEMVRIRKQDRIRISDDCVVALDNGERCEGAIRDLSSGGCGVRCVRNPSVQRNGFVALHFTLPDGTRIDGIRAVVRTVRSVGSGALLGCEFHGGDDLLRQDVNFYVTSTLDRMRGAPGSGRRALVIDSREDAIRTLKRALYALHIEMLVADGLVDAGYRLRMSNPVLVFVGNEQTQLSAVELCRIIRTTRGFESVPIFVYGGDSADLEREASEAGADGYFPSLTRIDDIRAAIAARIPATEVASA